jgi:chemotaxis protein MotB
MARDPRPQESDGDPGAPEWMVTFSDCMTLLLTFFVLLLTFSSFDDRVFRNLKVVYAKAFTSISVERRSDRDALMDMPPVRYLVELDKGSEMPTTAHGQDENLMKETAPVNLRRGLALLISSEELFWGKGTNLSSEGCRTMDLVGSFLKRVPSRIVISEVGPGDDRSSIHFGLPRAWAVVEYLTAKSGLDRERFSISQASSLPRPDSGTGSAGSRSERNVEVVLLERSIYN